MTDWMDEDLARWEESGSPASKTLDNHVLRRPIKVLRYPKHPLSVGPATPVGEVLERMASKNLGAVLVVEGGKLSGIFTERDALRKGPFLEGRERPVRDFMTANPDSLTPEDTIAFAMNRMGMGSYRHIPLVDSQHRPVGMLVMRDVVRYILQFFPAEAQNLPPHSEHDPPERNLEGG